MRTRFLPVALLAAGLGLCAAAQPAGVAGRADRVQAEATTIDTRTAAVGGEVTAIEKKVAELKQKLKNLPPPTERALAPTAEQEVRPRTGGAGAGPPRAEADAQETEYRLAYSRDSDLESSLLVVCLDKKVFLADFRAINEAKNSQIMGDDYFNAARLSRNRNREWVSVKGVLTVQGGDFNVAISVQAIPNDDQKARVRFRLLPRPGRTGETLEQATASGSTFRSRLANYSPDKHNVQFIVYPTGYEVFRDLRQIAWDGKFTDIAWVPYPVDGPIYLGVGSATAQ